ncbi:Endopolyphosphatase [Wickerhamomyces ciferrii]|uniref:Endopolyphosphatase n=1 Tax=Wickerhamomyces ciferrii (strain ATCC 14091 / BCRC 22168 / CBS 111 / JCM 3599 / NBRC 0793 / NRRL Y-1031 F-60-10) TaxID=1206466 RepID=K0L0E0_WICCF|nr:Endopolyphosphatase [Wickerhamomyces ciferrii]CCH46893.1 Endopolyphosphatase [Wickerhamomyces ciferrii]
MSIPKQNGTQRSIRYIRYIPLLFIVPLIYKYYTYTTTTSSSSTSIDTTPIQVSYNSINESEYNRLGLTPTPPITITHTNSIGQFQSSTYHGRFLHITDIHPDEYYKTNGLIDEACHRTHTKNGKTKGAKASKYGDALLGCDSPIILMNETFNWIEKNLKDKIDFIIWTGDNIRHDNDRKIPRTETQIFDMNRKVSQKFIKHFANHDSQDPRDFRIPVIPSLGNNDVFPHNLFSPGPTLQTRELWNIWSNFIPQDQLHVFERGAYFFQEVIPGKLAILSINTLYLFKSNPLVDNCDNKKDPGYKLFQWLGVVLQELRERKMKVWLSGHVPPVPKNYDLTCFRKYSIWLYEYRDIIIGGVYGHMNLDHFIPIDSKKAYDSYNLNTKDHEDESLSLEEQYHEFGIDLSDPFLSSPHIQGGAPSGKEEYMESVRKSFYKNVVKPSKQGDHGERYSIVNVAASVIPTFNPGLRVWEYNITGLEDGYGAKPWDLFFQDLETQMKNQDEDSFSFDDDQEFDENLETEGKKKKGKKGKKPKKPDSSLPSPKPDSEPLGPGYTPQTFSPTKFIQYYVNLTAVNLGDQEFNYELEYKSDKEPYNMPGLLVKDYLKLARDLAKPLKRGNEGKKLGKFKKLWDKYLEHVFVSTGYHD